MMKAQIKFMIGRERQGEEGKSHKGLVEQLERAREGLERARMNNEELENFIGRQHAKMLSLERENERLRKMLSTVKEGKNKMSERVIELSSKIYEL
jgi:cell shape-determining protein MreC